MHYPLESTLAERDVVTRLKAGMSCSEAMASVFAERLGLPQEHVRRAMSGFGGGIGGIGGPCGAVTGAIAVIGMVKAPEDPYDRKARYRMYKLVRQFMDEFTARCGSMQCAVLTGQDKETTPKAKAAAKARTDCSGFMAVAEDVLCDILELEPCAPAN